MRRPPLVIAHYDGIELLSEADIAELDEVADVLDPRPLGRWDDPRADDLLGRAEVLLGHWGCPRLDGEMLDRAPGLRLLAYAAGTVKEVITEEVFARGVRVTSGSVANAEPVAEYTLAMILLAGKDVLWRRDVDRDPALRSTRLASEVEPGNWHKTIGVVGASAVGRRVIELLRPFSTLAVALYDPYVTHDEAAILGVEKLDLDDLCGRVDILSIHAPALPETRHLVGAPQLAALRTGATVINTARGSLLDHQALDAELAAGRLYAILDVTDPEPLAADHPLRHRPTAFITPHLAGSEGTELGRLAAFAIEEVRRYATGEPPRNEVSRADLSRLA
ncbi:MAG: hydroxyacid dehydrogenase [Acidimicrobiales bacterium]